MTDRSLLALSDQQIALYSDLVESGWLLPSAPGMLAGLGPQAIHVFDGLAELIHRIADNEYCNGQLTPVYFPPVFSTQMLEQTEYVSSSPQLLGTINAFHGGTVEYRRILNAYERGDDWQSFLAPTGLALTSAACHPLFGYLEDTVADPDKVYELTGTTFRHEPSADPLRMIGFRAREYVRIGSKEQAQTHRELWMVLARDIFESLGLDVTIEASSDAFFGHGEEAVSADQSEPQPKYEVVTEVYPGYPTALASANYHATHFASTFDIGLPDGRLAHSACAAFGLDRIVLALAARHGFDVTSWPTSVQVELGLVETPATLH